MTLQRTAPATPDVPATPIGSNTQIVDTLDGGHEIADGLSRLLADTYTLYLKTHNYHWNVTGPMFAAVEMEHDDPTADILTQRIQAHEKSAWMLRSLLA